MPLSGLQNGALKPALLWQTWYDPPVVLVAAASSVEVVWALSGVEIGVVEVVAVMAAGAASMVVATPLMLVRIAV